MCQALCQMLHGLSCLTFTRPLCDRYHYGSISQMKVTDTWREKGLDPNSRANRWQSQLWNPGRLALGSPHNHCLVLPLSAPTSCPTTCDSLPFPSPTCVLSPTIADPTCRHAPTTPILQELFPSERAEQVMTSLEARTIHLLTNDLISWKSASIFLNSERFALLFVHFGFFLQLDLMIFKVRGCISCLFYVPNSTWHKVDTQEKCDDMI